MADDNTTQPVDGEPLLLGAGRHVTISHAWAQTPEGLLCDPAISDTAVRIFGVLHRYGQGDWTRTYPSHARIAARIGRSPRSIRGWIKELEDAGWVEVIPRIDADGQHSNAYHLNMALGAPPAPHSAGVPAPASADPPRYTARHKESNGKRASKKETEALPGLGADETARRLVDGWWESQAQRPTQNYVGAVKATKKVLDAGWDEPTVRACLQTMPCVSAGAFQVAAGKLNGHHVPPDPYINRPRSAWHPNGGAA